ncbi:MAG: hypothetical protein ACK53Y_03085 [bacterium]
MSIQLCRIQHQAKSPLIWFADDAPSNPSSSNIAGPTQTSSAKAYNNKPLNTHERQQYITVPNSTAFQAYATTHGIDA